MSWIESRNFFFFFFFFFFRACRGRIVIWSGMLSWSRCYRGHVESRIRDTDGVEGDTRRRREGSKKGHDSQSVRHDEESVLLCTRPAGGVWESFQPRMPAALRDCSSLGHTRDCFGNCIVLPVYDFSVISASLPEPSQNNGQVLFYSAPPPACTRPGDVVTTGDDGAASTSRPVPTSLSRPSSRRPPCFRS
jgi:hypothetical protein